MFAFKTFVALALPLFVVANPVVKARNDPQSCNSGSLACCNSTLANSNPVASSLLGLLGVVATVGAVLGLECDPITALGVGGNTCQQQTLCCSGNNFAPSGSSSGGSSLINFNCSPVNLNL